jgi:hypothetical protein
MRIVGDGECELRFLSRLETRERMRMRTDSAVSIYGWRKNGSGSFSSEFSSESFLLLSTWLDFDTWGSSRADFQFQLFLKSIMWKHWMSWSWGNHTQFGFGNQKGIRFNLKISISMDFGLTGNCNMYWVLGIMGNGNGGVSVRVSWT